MTPSRIEILIHYHVNNKDPHPRVDAPAVRDAVAFFVREGLLEPVVRGVHPLPSAPTYGPHQTTRKGATFIKMLCDTPFPTEQWVDPRTGRVIEEPYATAEAAEVPQPPGVPATCPGCGVYVGQKHLAVCAPALVGQPFTPLDSAPTCSLCGVSAGTDHLPTCASNLGGRPFIATVRVHLPDCTPNRCICGVNP